MHKKLMMAFMATAFGAFVIAPAASASPVLRENGVAAAVGSKIIATNVGEAVFTGTGGTEVKCHHVTLTGELIKNSGTAIESELTTADFNGTGVSTDCTSNLFNAPARLVVPHLCLRVFGSPVDEVVFTGCIGRPVEITMNFTGAVLCAYSRASVGAKFTTGGHTITMNNNEETLKSLGGAFCPAGGFLDMTFEIWTDTGVAHTRENALTIS